jgi:hypothetical protein
VKKRRRKRTVKRVSGLYIVEGNAGHKEFSCCVIL